ncbi:transposase [[Flexibacter] sp. ATCC 35208]|uniref:transposase n=1 Tax=[Flexibacter] sp. ATCC 35208 TaxID=1936242 RepID=UPI0009FB90D4|nr:transposase [[Flexibacter] sp. ATCC 35208]
MNTTNIRHGQSRTQPAEIKRLEKYARRNRSIFLPKDWTSNKKRCKAVGIPKERRVYRSKIDLSLDIVKLQVNLGTRFEIVGADGLYGNSNHFRQTLDDMELLYVLDVHIDQYVYQEPPNIYLSEKQGERGRNPTRYKSDSKAVKIRELCPEKSSKKWRQIRLRQTGKGDLVCKGYLQTVYTWDGESEDYRRLVMIIRAMPTPSGEIEYKYALSNSREDEFESTPHVQGKNIPGGVRAADPADFPRNNRFTTPGVIFKLN